MNKTVALTLAASLAIGGAAFGGRAQAQDAPHGPPPPPPGMAGGPGGEMHGPGPMGMDGHGPMDMHGHGPMDGHGPMAMDGHGPMGMQGHMMRRMREFALVYPARDRNLSGPDVQKIAEAFLLFNGNHSWKVTEVTEEPNRVTFAFATPDGTAIAHFAMDRHSARPERLN